MRRDEVFGQPLRKCRDSRRASPGFTMIEVLMVVLVIGILAVITIPKFADQKERAYVTTMRSDLKNTAGAAEAFYSENRTYVGFPGTGSSAGVTVTIVLSETGWSGHAVHASTAKTCDIQVGSAAVAPNNEGEPFCR